MALHEEGDLQHHVNAPVAEVRQQWWGWVEGQALHDTVRGKGRGGDWEAPPMRMRTLSLLPCRPHDEGMPDMPSHVLVPAGRQGADLRERG